MRRPTSRSRRDSLLCRACASLVDPLEPRRLLASVGIVSGVLTVNADGTNDVINIAPIPGGKARVTLNGGSSDHLLSAFTGIRVNGNGGNDKVTISNNLTKPATLKGGAGNDSLVGGGGNDLLDGGTGGDTMKGQGGNDTADYSARTASVVVGLGTLSDDGQANEHDNVAVDVETILGGSAADTLRGAANNNRIEGRGGNDTLIGLGGNDTLVGGTGTDRLEGGDGTDTGVDTTGDTLVSIEIGGPSGNTAVLQSNGTLVITGTQNADFIGITQNGASLEVGVNIKNFVFDAAKVARVTMNALAGNDHVELSHHDWEFGGRYTTPATVIAGDGNDTIVLLAAQNVNVIGGAGNDDLSLNEEAAVTGFDGGSGVDSYTDTYYGHPDVVTLHPTVENASTRNDDIIGNDLPNVLQTSIYGNITGGGGNDTITGGGEPDFGSNDLRGGAGNDTIFAWGNIQLVDGEAGNDIIHVMGTPSVRDSFFGGDGNDTIDYSALPTTGIVLRLGQFVSDDHFVDQDIETVIGSSGDDRIISNDAAHSIFGGNGNDTLIGNGGTDTLNGGGGTDAAGNSAGDTLISIENPNADTSDAYIAGGPLFVIGTNGADAINVKTNADSTVTVKVNARTWVFDPSVSFFLEIEVHAGGGNDNVNVAAVVDHFCLVYGEGGNDSVLGSAGQDHMEGGDGNDTLKGGGDNDLLYGDAGADHIEGQAGNDEIHGGDSSDHLFGGSGDDQLFGDAGDDFLYGQANADMLDGGSGNDSGFDDGVDVLEDIEVVLT